MNRRDFLKILGIGAAAVSTTTYFDMGKNLWRTNFFPEFDPNLHVVRSLERIDAYSLVGITGKGEMYKLSTSDLLAAPEKIGVCMVPMCPGEAISIEAIHMSGVGKVSLLAEESNDVRPNCLVKVA